MRELVCARIASRFLDGCAGSREARRCRRGDAAMRFIHISAEGLLCIRLCRKATAVHSFVSDSAEIVFSDLLYTQTAMRFRTLNFKWENRKLGEAINIDFSMNFRTWYSCR